MRAVGVFERLVGVLVLVAGWWPCCLDVLPVAGLRVEGELERVDAALLDVGGLLTLRMDTGRRDAGDTPRADRDDLSRVWLGAR